MIMIPAIHLQKEEQIEVVSIKEEVNKEAKLEDTTIAGINMSYLITFGPML
jgi:hypothetical protein